MRECDGYPIFCWVVHLSAPCINQCAKFHLNMIAEGVKTEAQLSLLKHLGCMAYQGYFFSTPVPVEQLDALL